MLRFIPYNPLSQDYTGTISAGLHASTVLGGSCEVLSGNMTVLICASNHSM